MPPPGPPTRLEEVPEPDALLRAYQAALAGDATIPPVEPLRALLFDAAEKGAPLSSLSLRGVPVGRHGARALANVLYLDSFITFANLEDCSLGDDGAIAVAESLRTHPTLFRLDLGYNGVSGKGVKAIAQLLLESPSLLCLDLSGNNLYSRLNLVAPSALSNLAPLGKALSSPRCKLQLLHLDHADVEVKGLTSLVDGLLPNETVVNLRLGENGLDTKSAQQLARLLKGNHTLTSVDLRENKLKDEGAAALAEALPHNHGLRCLVLWSNGIGGAGISSLAKGLGENKTIQILDIGDNRVDEAVRCHIHSSLHTSRCIPFSLAFSLPRTRTHSRPPLSPLHSLHTHTGARPQDRSSHQLVRTHARLGERSSRRGGRRHSSRGRRGQQVVAAVGSAPEYPGHCRVDGDQHRAEEQLGAARDRSRLCRV